MAISTALPEDFYGRTKVNYEERCRMLEDRVKFLQNELEAVMKTVVDTQATCLRAQEIAIERGWQLIEARQKLQANGIT